jgi:hypothetical protein
VAPEENQVYKSDHLAKLLMPPVSRQRSSESWAEQG